MSQSTVSVKLPETQRVRTLRVEVIAGADRGQSVHAEDDQVSVGTAHGNDLVLTDETVSRFHLELRSVEDGIQVLDCGSTNGTFVTATRVERAVIVPNTVLILGNSQLRVTEGEDSVAELHEQETLGGLLGRTPVMRRLMVQLKMAASRDIPVLIVGESGTGKELVAEALHDLGGRGQGPLVTFDCATLSPGLVASALFGHERGAFTGASARHAGAFEQANGGTLLLDEIGELPFDLQASLLGVLERRRFRRVGGQAEVGVSCRVLAATNRDLRAEVNAGNFRLDLYYRLAVGVLRVPPLRERTEDIPLLVEHFLHEAGHWGPVEAIVDEPTTQRLMRYQWPGNVRELRNFVEARLTMGDALAIEDQPALAHGDDGRPDGAIPAADAPPWHSEDLADLTYKEARARVLHAFETRFLERLMQRVNGNVSEAARQAGIDRTHVFKLLRRHHMR